MHFIFSLFRTVQKIKNKSYDTSIDYNMAMLFSIPQRNLLQPFTTKDRLKEFYRQVDFQWHPDIPLIVHNWSLACETLRRKTKDLSVLVGRWQTAMLLCNEFNWTTVTDVSVPINCEQYIL